MKSLLIVMLLLSGLFGAERVTTTKQLGPGQKSIFYPKRGDSFRVTKDLSRYLPDASYDIVMKNGREIYFHNDDQREDMYIIFNEPLAKGDMLILKVNRGYFRYTTESIQKLPTRVKKLLKAAAKRKSVKKSRQQKRENGVTITQEEFCFDNRGDIVPCDSSRATINQKPVAHERVAPKAPKAQKEATPKQTAQPERANNIFATFAEKLASAFARIKTTLAENRAREAKEAEQRAKEAKKSAAVKNRSDEKTRTVSESKPSDKRKPAAATPAEIEKYAHVPDATAHIHTPLQIPHFAPIPTEQTRPSFAYEELKLGAVTAPPVIAATPPAAKITASRPPQAPAYRQPEFAKRDRLSPLDDLSMPYQQPQYQTTAPAIKAVQGPEPSLPVAKPQLSGKTGVREPVPATLPDRKVTAPKMPAMEPIAKPSADIVAPAPAAEKRVQPVVVPQQPATQIAQEQVGEPKVQQPEPEPLPAEAAESQESAPADRIVITKTIQANQPAAQPAAPMERMRDRVLGGGYDAGQSTGRLSVRAYANRKPVSAWVEVYHGKRRVKTFYTGVKKEVNLPEGTYILKATYRTGTSKQKKNLGKVHLKSGESIRKKVYFHIGTLNVVAKKRGKPIYVKVEIFRKGSKSRYAYTFSSRTTGIAHLQLAQGRYRIVVREHGNVKTFDNIYVKGGRLKTLVAEF